MCWAGVAGSRICAGCHVMEVSGTALESVHSYFEFVAEVAVCFAAASDDDVAVDDVAAAAAVTEAFCAALWSSRFAQLSVDQAVVLIHQGGMILGSH